MSKSLRRISKHAYDWYPELGLAKLTKDAPRMETPVRGHVAAVPHGLLGADGSLWITAGFVWDLGSWPALNDPPMVYASLAHDMLYEMIEAGELPRHERKNADKFFKYQLKKAGAGWFSRTRRYWGVRLGYPLRRWFNGGKSTNRAAKIRR